MVCFNSKQVEAGIIRTMRFYRFLSGKAWWTLQVRDYNKLKYLFYFIFSAKSSHASSFQNHFTWSQKSFKGGVVCLPSVFHIPGICLFHSVLIILGDNYCQVPKCVQWATIGVYSALKRLCKGTVGCYCLPKETFCHPETSAFYLKHWRRNGSIFEIYSLSIKHQRKENKIGYEGNFCSLIHTLFSFSLLGRKGGLLAWKVLLLLNFSIYTDLHTSRNWLLCPSSSSFSFSGRARCSFRVGVCFSVFCGEVCSLILLIKM